MRNIKLTFRNARKNGTLTFAKLFGIVISFSVVLFVAGYVYYEISFDRFIPDHDKIFRCLMTGKLNGQDADFAVTSPAMAKAVVNDIPEIKEAIRITTHGNASFWYKGKLIEGGSLYSVDSNFFTFFSIPIKKELQNPFESENNLTIAKSLAKRHFGSAEIALNKKVRLRGEDYIITGIFDDLPENFHLQFKLLQSIAKINPDEIGWGSQSYHTYIKTHTNNIDNVELNFKLTKTVYSHSDERIDGSNATTWEELKWSDETYIFYPAERLKDIHFSSHKFDLAITSNSTYVYGAIILAVLVLLISSINYVNLSIANLTTRFKEIGIYKTYGAYKKQIIKLFISESLVFWFFGFILSVIIYEITSKTLTKYLDIEFHLSPIVLAKIIVFTFIALIILNVATNILPIYFISKKNSLNLIKGERYVKSRFSIKSSFIFLQFILSALIIIASIIVQKQINFLTHKDRGYDTENVLMFSEWVLSSDQRGVFIDELQSHSAIKNVSTCNLYFGSDPSMGGAFFEIPEDKNFFHTSILEVDDEFINTLDLKIEEGRFFEKERQTDFETVILNETAVKEYQKSGSLIGKNVYVRGNALNVIGVVKDFNYRSLHHKIQPLVIIRGKNQNNILIKINNNRIPEVISILEKQWDKFEIPIPLEYTFHDELLASQYMKDQQAKKLLLVLSIISITIACIGLYAISYFIIVRRTKEIGIRKVNGAKTTEVVIMLNISFIKWVAIAFVIASPISYYFINKWLQNFAYKTNISWWVFALAGGIALTIALLTVSWQSWRAANRNPVEALRYE